MSTAPRNVVLMDAIIRKIPNPCLNCADRTVGCHGGCKRHSEYKAKVDVEFDKAQKAYLIERRLYKGNVESRSRLNRNVRKYKYWSAYRKGGAK